MWIGAQDMVKIKEMLNKDKPTSDFLQCLELFD